MDELIDMHEQEQAIEEVESLDSVQSEDGMTVDSRLNNAFKLCNFVSKIMVLCGIRIAHYVHFIFWLNGYVNKQNCRIWSEANPQVYVETPLHPEKLTVWCALWAGGFLLQKR
ncbi:uncharacterized protein TNCV_30081 [Trichonephila clavipes]|nr:uncharacterized protein TNCV_30081 [Trichonephila clavipes]